MDELQLQVVVDDSLPDDLEGPIVAIGSFNPSETVFVYSSLRVFFEELVLGRPLPLKLVARSIEDIDSATMVALFLDRRLALNPAMSALVGAIDLGMRYGPSGLASVDRDLGRFIALVRAFLRVSGSKDERGEQVKTAVGWIQRYVQEGELPSLPPEPKPPRVLDIGSNGFVVAESEVGVNLVDSWVELYRLGYLRGVVFGPSIDGRRAILCARKSPFVDFRLDKLALILNEAERAMGELPGWEADDLWLWGPEDGSFLLPSDVIGVLVRV